MWFKQAQIFQLTAPMAYDAEQLEQQLAAFAFSPCLPSLPSTYGFISPFDLEGAPLVHAGNHCLMFCLQFEEKILPATVVRHALREKIKHIAASQSRSVSQKEKNEMKEEVTQTLLPRAFSKLTKVYGYIDTRQHYVVLDTTAALKTEKLIALLGRAVAGLQLEYVETKRIATLMTHWLLDGDYPVSLFIEKKCVLRDPKEMHRVIRCQHQELSAEGVLSLIKDGCEVNQLAFAWHDRVSFVLHDNFVLSGLRFHDVVLALAKSQDAASSLQKLDADFFIMTETLQALFADLFAACCAETAKSPAMVGAASPVLA